MRRVDHIIIRPLLTEKSSAAAEETNTYAFAVGNEATKIEIKEAVERLFEVRVETVRTLVVRGKIKRFGRHYGKRPNWKKAYVTLSDNDAINVYGGAA